MGILKKIGDFFKGLLNFPALQDIKEGFLSLIMYVFYADASGATSLTNVQIMDSLIQVGMLIIIWYGVIKILLNLLWRFLFGKKLEWKIGILELFFGRLKPVYAQRTAEMTDAEIDEKTERYLEQISKVTHKITKDDTRRCCKMKFVKNLAAKARVNLKTNTAIGTVGALVVAAGGYIASGDVAVVDTVYNAVGIGPAEALAATAVAAAGLVVPGILGKGRQTQEEFAKMLKEKKDAKEAKKAAKAAGAPAKTVQERAEAYAKKHNLSVQLATQIVKEQDAKAAQEAAEAKKAREEKIVAKIAKKQNVSEAMARQIRADQIKQLAK